MTEGPRRLDRERVMSLLYEVEMKDASAEAVLDELPVAPDPFVVETVRGVDAAQTDIDAYIDKHSRDWDIDRMASVDRNILRVGTWELLQRPELSVAIIINEALELAKKYSTDESAKFINGILDAIAADIRS